MVIEGSPDITFPTESIDWRHNYKINAFALQRHRYHAYSQSSRAQSFTKIVQAPQSANWLAIRINRFRNNVLFQQRCLCTIFLQNDFFDSNIVQVWLSFFWFSFDNYALSYVWRPYGRKNRSLRYDTVIMTIRQHGYYLFSQTSCWQYICFRFVYRISIENYRCYNKVCISIEHRIAQIFV